MVNTGLIIVNTGLMMVNDGYYGKIFMKIGTDIL